jgi:hypothetical protein
LATAPNKVKFPAKVDPAANNSQYLVSPGGTRGCSRSTAGTLEIKLDKTTVTPKKLAAELIAWVKGWSKFNFCVTRVRINNPENITSRFQSTFCKMRWGLTRRVINNKLAATKADSPNGKPIVNAISSPIVMTNVLLNKGLKIRWLLVGNAWQGLTERTSG